MVRHWAPDSRVVGSKPAVASFEESILGPGNTNWASPPRGINGSLVCSYECHLSLHPAKC